MVFLKSIFVIKNKDDKRADKKMTASRGITSQGLMDKISAVFEDYIDRESVGKRMIYPMSFNVLMHRNDYNSRKETLFLVLPEIVANFYRIIRRRSTQFPEFTNAANYWFFQFSPTLIDSLPLDNGDVLQIEQGNPAIAASLFSKDESENGASNVSVENNVNVSICCLNSNVQGTANLNIKTLVGVDMLAEGVFKFKFDPKMLADITTIVPTRPDVFANTVVPTKPESTMNTTVPNGVETPGYATLTYQKDGKTYRYTMKDQQVVISGSSETNKVRSVFKVESDRVGVGHVIVRYLASDNKFQMAANGPVHLNGRTVKISSSGELEWHDLSNRSRIFINDALTVHFEKLI